MGNLVTSIDAVGRWFRSVSLAAALTGAATLAAAALAAATGTVAVAAAESLSATVGSLHIEGNTRTDPEVILRAAEIAPGSAYTDALPDVVRQRVYNLRVFDTVAVEASGT